MLTNESTLDGVDSSDSHPAFVPGDYPLLTQSQEMHLFADHDLGIMVNNFLENDDEEWKAKTSIYEDLLERQPISETELSYPVMPDVLPELNTAHPQVPSLVSNENYPGPFKFDLYIAAQSGNKNPWVYSTTLNKLFIAISTAFPIDFKCNWPTKNLYIRATPVFSLAQHSQDLVTRCLAHVTPNESNNKSVPEFVWNHVIRCQNSNALYNGSVEDNVRLSVVIPLETPQTGTDCVRVLYMFVCKNSCPSGMNRRPFEVVFTLEDASGQVFGRHNLNVRVCSCPKRDKEKEEKIYLKENGNLATASGKKKKVVDGKKLTAPGDYPIDTKEYTLTMNVCGKHNIPLILKHYYNLMAGDLREHGPNENIEKCLNDIAEKRRRFE